MFKSCPECKGWGLRADDVGFNMIKCPDCVGKGIVPLIKRFEGCKHEEIDNSDDFYGNIIELRHGKGDD